MAKDIEPGSGEWQRVWGALEAALKGNPLPADGGGAVECGIEDFMFMGMDDSGAAHFKNVATRNYLLIAHDGALSIPTGGAWCGGVFGRAA